MKLKKTAVVVAATLAAGMGSAAVAQDTGLSARYDIGLGYDSNVYESNSQSYIDYYADPTGNTTASVKVQGGMFIPYRADLGYVLSSTPVNEFSAFAKINGESYLGSNLSNADTYDVRGSLNDAIKLSQASKGRNQIDLAFEIGRVNRVYYDHDDGVDKLTSASLTNISNRYTYSVQSLRADWEHSLSRVLYKAGLNLENRDYEDPVVVSQLDSSILEFDASAKFPVSRGSKARLGYGYRNRDYSDKKAKNLDGTIATGVLLNQTYNTFLGRLYSKFGKSIRTKLAADYETRTDTHVGYSDYVKTTYLVQGEYVINDIWQVSADYRHWERDYDRAWAFDTSVSGDRLFVDSGRWRLQVGGRLTKVHRLEFSLESESVSSTDDRYAFDRTIVMATYTYRGDKSPD